MNRSLVCAATLIVTVLGFGTASAGPRSESTGTWIAAIQQTDHPSALGGTGTMERKYGPKWCQRHPRKCAKAGVPPS